MILTILRGALSSSGTANDGTRDEQGILNVLYGHPVDYVDNLLDITDTPEIYNVTLVEMSDDFKIRFRKAYIKDKY